MVNYLIKWGLSDGNSNQADKIQGRTGCRKVVLLCS